MIDKTLLELGRRLRRIRMQSHLSQESLAFKSGLHPNHIGAIERGEKNPTIKTLHRLCKTLKITVSQLLDSL